jgi:hypothetical protein
MIHARFEARQTRQGRRYRPKSAGTHEGREDSLKP